MFNLFKNNNKMTNSKESCDNIVASIAKCKTLHKKLILLAHPDKHPDDKEFAEKLSMEINKFRYNYKELQRIEEILNSKLK